MSEQPIEQQQPEQAAGESLDNVQPEEYPATETQDNDEPAPDAADGNADS